MMICKQKRTRSQQQNMYIYKSARATADNVNKSNCFRFAPKVSKILVKTLKPVALFLIMFIIVFGVWANLYIFKLMTWQVFLVGMGLPWLGFMSGCGIAMIFKRPVEDVIAIAIETGVQNTGMSIFILWFTLDQPLGDMTGNQNM
jgi:sodium/bile acid cotransporter 3/5